MKNYTLEEAKAALKPFGINVYPDISFSGKVFGYNFQSNNCERMEKADGYDSQGLKPSDFNMIIDGWKEK